MLCPRNLQRKAMAARQWETMAQGGFIEESYEKSMTCAIVKQLIFNNLTQFLWLKTALHSGSPEPASKRHQQHTKTIH